MDLQIKGKVAIVTGASTGIGEAVAREFAKNDVKVILTARGAESLDRAVNAIRSETGAEIEGIPADVAEPNTPA